MTQKEYKTVRAGSDELHQQLDNGYRLLGRYQEPNASYSYEIQHPRTLRSLVIKVQPRWGMVLIEEGSRVLKIINFD